MSRRRHRSCCARRTPTWRASDASDHAGSGTCSPAPPRLSDASAVPSLTSHASARLSERSQSGPSTTAMSRSLRFCSLASASSHRLSADAVHSCGRSVDLPPRRCRVNRAALTLDTSRSKVSTSRVYASRVSGGGMTADGASVLRATRVVVIDEFRSNRKFL